RTLTGHSGVVLSVAYSPDGRYLASGSQDKTIKIWEVATGKELRTLTGHSGWVNSVVYSPDGRYLASGSWDNTIKIWRVGQ
ncbi:MAG: WD40 repeat domain-containing protein, partial [Microcystis panniformis]